MKKRILSILLSLCMTVMLLPAVQISAAAADTIPYINENGNQQSVPAASATQVTSDMTAWSDGWYYVSGTVTISNTVTVSDNVNLILEDGCSLSVTAASYSGIALTSGNSLTIYGQTEGTGSLTVTSNGQHGSGIGSYYDDAGCGTLIINGGIVITTGGQRGAGIGGGSGSLCGGAGGSVTINGGEVTALGGSWGGAGIGGGGAGIGKIGGDGGSVTISGGSINASAGDSYAQAIGHGSGSGISGTLQNASSTNVYLTTVTLDGVITETAVTSLTADLSSSPYPYGITDMRTDENGKLYLYLPANTETTAAATASSYAGSVITPASGTLYVVPTISSVSVPTSGNYTAGDTLDFTVSFNMDVTVDTSGGTPYLPLTVGSTTVNATYQSGSGTNELLFRYTVQSGQNDSDGIAVGSSIGLNGGSLQSSHSIDAVLTLEGVGSSAGILVDTTKPTVSAATPAASATGVPANGNVVITFSETMNPSAGTVSLTPVGGSTISLTGGAWSSGDTIYTASYSGLAHNTSYTLSVSGFSDTTGNVMSAYSHSFTTELDPVIPSVSPESGSTTASITGANGTSGTVSITTSGGTASAEIGSAQSNALAGGGALELAMPTVKDAVSYGVKLPVSSLRGNEGGTLTMETDLGGITVPSNMLSSDTSDKTAEITIGQGNKENLPEDVKAAVGSRPLVQLTLSIDGTQIDWSNPAAPVTVSIPYTPTAEELANQESIVVWYIDGSGNLVTIPNGHYDPATGNVTFFTTHFSQYAVGYNNLTFSDVPKNAWYCNAVGFIAARGITGGTSNTNFSPDATLKRGQFITMLMRAYGIDSDDDSADNFSDAGDTYYTGYLATAKRLGISNGVGDNKFAPEQAISRQQMFTLLYNTLKKINRLPEGDSGKTLSDFKDGGSISSYAMEAMDYLVKSGAVSGSSGYLIPTATTTRAQMAQVIYNLLET